MGRRTATLRGAADRAFGRMSWRSRPFRHIRMAAEHARAAMVEPVTSAGRRAFNRLEVRSLSPPGFGRHHEAASCARLAVLTKGVLDAKYEPLQGVLAFIHRRVSNQERFI